MEITTICAYTLSVSGSSRKKNEAGSKYIIVKLLYVWFSFLRLILYFIISFGTLNVTDYYSSLVLICYL